MCSHGHILTYPNNSQHADTTLLFSSLVRGPQSTMWTGRHLGLLRSTPLDLAPRKTCTRLFLRQVILVISTESYFTTASKHTLLLPFSPFVPRLPATHTHAGHHRPQEGTIPPRPINTHRGHGGPQKGTKRYDVTRSHSNLNSLGSKQTHTSSGPRNLGHGLLRKWLPRPSSQAQEALAADDVEPVRRDIDMHCDLYNGHRRQRPGPNTRPPAPPPG